MRKLFLLSVVAGLFFAACGMKSETSNADTTTAVIDTTAVVAVDSAVTENAAQ